MSPSAPPVIDLTGLPPQAQISAAVAMFKRARNNPDRVKVSIKADIRTDFLSEWALGDTEWNLAQ